MYISFNWLKEFVKIPYKITPEELGSALTLHTVEVEGFEERGAEWKNIVVGKVKEVKKHPNADKLQIVITDVGAKKLQIVCGGSNVREGMLVAVGMSGAKVRWHGEGEPVELKETELRGVKSEGMICASNEIGLGEAFPAAEKEILDLTDFKLKPGDSLASALHLEDVIYEIDNKSVTHRPDLWGHYGMARDAAAFLNLPFEELKLKKIREGASAALKVAVEEETLCPKYCAIVLENVAVGPSPLWLKSRLEACGVRSVNTIVDVTNYVMLELGQPLHAFNARVIHDGNIIVRKAKTNETLVTLDGVSRTLDDSMLVIADDKKVLALAGVMGGAQSEIQSDTKSIVLEAATFDPVSVRKTSQTLGLRTEASQRFEKSLDPNLPPRALIRAVNLLKEVCPKAKAASPLADISHFSLNQGPLELSLDFVRRRIGAALSKEEISSILERLGFKTKVLKKDMLSVAIPSFRATKDVSIREDFIEEIARVHGYDRIPALMPVVTLERPPLNEERALERKIKNLCALGLGMTETYNYSFVEEEVLKQCLFDPASVLRVANPIAKDIGFLRPSLLPNLLSAAARNFKWKENFALFEMGRVFRAEDGPFPRAKESNVMLPRQDIFIAGVIVANEYPFFEAKHALEAALKAADVAYNFLPMKGVYGWVHPARVASVSVGGKVVGLVTEVNPLVVKNFDTKKRVGYFELNFSALAKAEKIKQSFAPLPKYPSITLDLAILIPEKTEWADVRNAVCGAGGELVEDVSLFDVYAGKNIGAGKKSMAFHVTYRSPSRTLELAEAQKIQDRVKKTLEENFGAQIR